jgi:hypothetical protein
MDRQPNSGASPPTHTHRNIHFNISRNRNRSTINNETGSEVEGMSRRAEIPPRSQRREGASVMAEVETDVHSM